jgi:putative NADH-flavin reductase
MSTQKVLIIGATGPAGKILVEQTLAEGHSVTALVRNPEKLTINHDRLQVLQGDALDAEAVQRAVQGQDAVFVLISPPSLDKPSTVSSEATRTIVAAMEQAGVRRLVCVTALGLGNSKQNGNFLYNRLILPLVLKHVIVDKARQEEAIVASNLDWTIIRPARLTDEPARGEYLVLADAPGKVNKMARSDLAAAMLAHLNDPRYVRQAVVVGY